MFGGLSIFLYELIVLPFSSNTCITSDASIATTIEEVSMKENDDALRNVDGMWSKMDKTSIRPSNI